MALMPVEDALARILRGVKPLPAEIVPLKFSHGRILAKAIKATRDQPPFPASAMDGYAVRHEDISKVPANLKLTGTSAAGHAYKRTMKSGEAVRILTGAPLPKGADTIVIQENTKREGTVLRIDDLPPKGKNIRPMGLDFKRGSELIAKATRINARDIGLAAAGDTKSVSVHRRPRVVLFTTGDELVLPGEKRRADQIVSSNSYAIEAMARAWGASVTNLGIVKDTLKATETAIRKGLGVDVLITTGGASVGDHDFVQEALKNCGVSIDFWKIALRPGKPLMFGTKGNTRVIGLPGNPVSALVCSRIFIKPLIELMQGIVQDRLFPVARLTTALQENDNRKDYVRASMSTSLDGTRTVTPYSTQDSSMQRTLRNAQCLIIREPFAPAARSGDEVSILILDF
jgi:molybdopterin molybdotransferase